MTEEKGNSGVVKAEGRVEGIMAPGGTWWSTRFPGSGVSAGPQKIPRDAYPFHGGSAYRK